MDHLVKRRCDETRQTDDICGNGARTEAHDSDSTDINSMNAAAVTGLIRDGHHLDVWLQGKLRDSEVNCGQLLRLTGKTLNCGCGFGASTGGHDRSSQYVYLNEKVV